MGICKSKQLINMEDTNSFSIELELPDSSTDGSNSKNSRTILFFLNNEFNREKKSSLDYNGTQTIKETSESEGESIL